ncbi:GGDEF domain-containing protein [Tsukamurella soli]|uniref:PAS domain S-box-containing protein/diguanylate cyclase (GGDEF) domain-containing protein n=1 Tax=Tsukamurella soli TaxID=644556 RepID=A0ABP8K6R4_9ACTN
MDRAVNAAIDGWYRRVASLVPDPVPDEVLRSALGDAAEGLVAALGSQPLRLDAAATVGAELVVLGCADPTVLDYTAELVAVLVEHGHVPLSDAAHSAAALSGAVGRGYAQALLRRDSRSPLHDAIGAVRASIDQQIRDADVRFELVFNHASLAIAVLDTAGRLVYINPAFVATLGRDPKPIPGTLLLDSVYAPDRPRVRDVFRSVVAAGSRTARTECRFPHDDGDYGLGMLTLTSVPAADSGQAYVLAVWEDTTDRRRMHDELRRLALHDHLTGLPNRAHLLDTLTRAVDPRTTTRIGALLYIAVDGFKEINDDYGRAVGDFAVRAASYRLQQAIGDEGIVTRIGGGQFAVILTGPASDDRVRTLVERVHLALGQPIATTETDEFVPHAVIGTTILAPRDRRTPDEILDDADADVHNPRRTGA